MPSRQEGCFFPERRLRFFFVCVAFSESRVVRYHTHVRPLSSSLYFFSRAARQISLHHHLLCQREGECLRVCARTCVCVIPDSASFCNGGFFHFVLQDTAVARKLATCPTPTPLRSLHFSPGRRVLKSRGWGRRGVLTLALHSVSQEKTDSGELR